MAKEAKAVATHQTSAVANIDEMAKTLSQGQDEYGFGAGDAKIATLLLMQPASDMVSGSKAKLGDIVRNEDETVIAGLDKPLEVIPLYKFETVRFYNATDGKFVGEVPYVAGTKVDREGVENGIPVRKYRTINFFFLLPEDVKNGGYFPVLMRFKSTALRAAEDLASFVYKKKFFGKLPYDFTSAFEVERRKNEKNQNWATLKFKAGRPTTDQEKAIAKQMVTLINAKRYQVVDAEDADEVSEDRAAKPVVVDAEVVGQSEGQY